MFCATPPSQSARFCFSIERKRPNVCQIASALETLAARMELRQQEACGTLREALAEAERRSRAALAASQERERELQRTQAETCAAKLATGPAFRFTPSVHALHFVERGRAQRGC